MSKGRGHVSCVVCRGLYVLRRALNARHLTILLLVLLLHSLALAQGDVNRAGLVVRYGDGRVETYCVSFSEPSITGAELLRRAGLEIIAEYNSAMGEAICKINGEGCDYPLEPCFCQCQGAECQYWAYYHLEGGEWVYSQVGAGSYQVRDGNVEGWAWGAGEPGRGTLPPLVTFDQICAVDTPTPTATPSPSATPTLSPTPTPTLTPSPTFTSSPSPTASPTRTPPAHPVPTLPPSTPAPAALISPTVSPTSAPTSSAPPFPLISPTPTATFSPTPSPFPSSLSTAALTSPVSSGTPPSHLQASTPTLPPQAVRVVPPRPNPARVLISPTPSREGRRGTRAPTRGGFAYLGTLMGLAGVALFVYWRHRRAA